MPDSNIPRPQWKVPEKPHSFWKRLLLGFLEVFTIFGAAGGAKAAEPQNATIAPPSYRTRTREGAVQGPQPFNREIIGMVVRQRRALESHPTQIRAHTVLAGESLWTIAQKAYGVGRGDRWVDIWETNKSALQSGELVVGQSITLPPRRQSAEEPVMPEDLTATTGVSKKKKAATDIAPAAASLQGRTLRNTRRLARSLDMIAQTSARVLKNKKDTAGKEAESARLQTLERRAKRASRIAERISASSTKGEMLNTVAELTLVTRRALHTAARVDKNLIPLPTASALMDALIVSETTARSVATPGAPEVPPQQIMFSAAGQVLANFAQSLYPNIAALKQFGANATTEQLAPDQKIIQAIAETLGMHMVSATLEAGGIDGSGGPSATGAQGTGQAGGVAAQNASNTIVGSYTSYGISQNTISSLTDFASAMTLGDLAAGASRSSMVIGAIIAGNADLATLTGLEGVAKGAAAYAAQAQQAAQIGDVKGTLAAVAAVGVIGNSLVGTLNTLATGTYTGLAIAQLNELTANTLLRAAATFSDSASQAAANGDFVGSFAFANASMEMANAAVQSAPQTGFTYAAAQAVISAETAAYAAEAALTATLESGAMYGSTFGPQGTNFSAAAAVAAGFTNFGGPQALVGNVGEMGNYSFGGPQGPGPAGDFTGEGPGEAGTGLDAATGEAAAAEAGAGLTGPGNAEGDAGDAGDGFGGDAGCFGGAGAGDAGAGDAGAGDGFGGDAGCFGGAGAGDGGGAGGGDGGGDGGGGCADGGGDGGGGGGDGGGGGGDGGGGF